MSIISERVSATTTNNKVKNHGVSLQSTAVNPLSPQPHNERANGERPTAQPSSVSSASPSSTRRPQRRKAVLHSSSRDAAAHQSRVEFVTDPLEKFSRDGRFPFKLVLNLLLILLLSAQILMNDVSDMQAEQQQRQSLLSLLLTQDPPLADVPLCNATASVETLSNAASATVCIKTTTADGAKESSSSQSQQEAGSPPPSPSASVDWASQLLAKWNGDLVSSPRLLLTTWTEARHHLMRLWRLYYQLVPLVSTADYDYLVLQEEEQEEQTKPSSPRYRIQPPRLAVSTTTGGGDDVVELSLRAGSPDFQREIEQRASLTASMTTLQRLCPEEVHPGTACASCTPDEELLTQQWAVLRKSSPSLFSEFLEEFHSDNLLTGVSPLEPSLVQRQRSFLQAALAWKHVTKLTMTFQLHQELHVQGAGAATGSIAWMDVLYLGWVWLTGETVADGVGGGRAASLMDPDDNGFQSTIYVWWCTVTFERRGTRGLHDMILTAEVTRTLERQRLTGKGVFFLVTGVAIGLLALLDAWLRYRALQRIWLFNESQTQRALRALDVEHQEEEEEEHSEATTLTHTAAGTRKSPKEQWQSFLMEGKGESWHYWGLLTSFAAVLYAIILTVEYGVQAPLSEAALLGKRVSLGFAALGATSLSMSFLRFAPRVYVLFRATRGVLPELVLIFLAALPLFFGFALTLFGVFGQESDGEFSSLSSSFVHLIFMMYGDSLLPAVKRLNGAPASPALRMMATGISCLYVFLFMSVVHNVAIAAVVNYYGKTVQESGLGDDDIEVGIDNDDNEDASSA